MPSRLFCLKAESARRVLKGDSGVVALEFALTAPVLLLIVLASMAFAIQFGVLVGVIHAASEGARASIGGLGSADRASLAEARVQQIFQSYGPLMSPDRVSVTTADGAGTYAVTVNYNVFDLGLNHFTRYWTKQTINQITYTATVGDGGY